MSLEEQEEAFVRALGESIGYGRTMQLASQLWRKKPGVHPGSEFVVGPCEVMVVKCTHPESGRDKNGHCDWCCGCGWVTKKVAAISQPQNGPGT